MTRHWSRRLYRRLLWLYPHEIRERFGVDMAECFDDLIEPKGGGDSQNNLQSWQKRQKWEQWEVLRTALPAFFELPISAARAHAQQAGSRLRSPRPNPGAHSPPPRYPRRNTMDGIWSDFRYAARALLRSPGLSALAVVSLALGLGANTTMLGMVGSLIWQKLPVPEAERIVRVFEVRNGEYSRLSYANFRDLREQAGDTLENLTVHRLEAFGLRSDGESEVVYGELVSGSYFDTLRVRPAAGRLFTHDEAGTSGGPAIAVLSHDLWQRRFDGDPAVVGRTLRLNDQPFEVVGVAEQKFQGTKYGLGMDLWVPVTAWARVAGWSESWDQARGSSSWLGVARLREGVSQSQAEESLATVASRLVELDPEANRALRLAVLNELDGGIDPHVAGMPRLIGLLAIGASALVLLVACANVASLLFARGLSRSREIGVRYALGVRRSRLMRQLLSESVLLSLLGGALGVVAAFWTTRLVLLFLPALPYRFVIDPAPDLRVVAIAAGVSLLGALIAGLAPAFQASSSSPMAAVQRAGVSSGRRRHRGLNAVVVSMVALSFVSLVLSGLFLRSLEKVRSTDPGFETANRVVARFDVALAGDQELRPEVFARELVRRTLEQPGVVRAAVSSLMPLGDRSSSSQVFADDRTYGEDDAAPEAWRASVTDDFFATMGARIFSGRAFGARDRADSAQVVILNQTLAERLWPDGEAIGRRIRFERAAGGDSSMEVVGVVADAKYVLLNERQQPAYFRPFEQSPRTDAVLVAETAGDPSAQISTLERAVRSLDPRVPVLDVQTVEHHVESSLWLFRLGAGIAASLGFLALGLSAAGLYGVMSYAVGERRHELGIRQAMGATSRQLIRLVYALGLRLTALGMAFGLVIALGIAGLLGSVLFGIQPTDPSTLTGVCVTLLLVAGVAILVPAFSASRSDPVTTLRDS